MSMKVAKIYPPVRGKGVDFPGAESLWRAPNHCGGRRITVEGAESPNKVTRTVFNAVHLLPKNRICEHGGGKLASCP